jgi:hypothetical protein
MQNQTVKHHFAPIRRARISKRLKTAIGRDMKKQEAACAVLVGV